MTVLKLAAIALLAGLAACANIEPKHGSDISEGRDARPHSYAQYGDR